MEESDRSWSNSSNDSGSHRMQENRHADAADESHPASQLQSSSSFPRSSPRSWSILVEVDGSLRIGKRWWWPGLLEALGGHRRRIFLTSHSPLHSASAAGEPFYHGPETSKPLYIPYPCALPETILTGIYFVAHEIETPRMTPTSTTMKIGRGSRNLWTCLPKRSCLITHRWLILSLT